ncbi:MAG TPA: glycosyltransferase [Chthonomonadales bacterium]|nr:glycosyltransferase [Chthonomonadales bacterium]
MRIGMFSECFEPVQNGVSISVRTLVDELRARRHHVFVVAPHHPDHQHTPFVLRVPSWVTPFNTTYPVSYPFFPRLRRKLCRVGPHLLHSHQPFFLGLLAARLARQADIPLVSTYHTLYNHYGHYLFFLPGLARQTLLEWWLPEYYNRCTCVIVPSRIAEESLRRYGVRTRIEVIPTAVPIPPPSRIDEAACLAVREQWGIPPAAPLLLYVGRLAKEKNLELVFHAFEHLAPEFPEARLMVVGGGPNEEEYRKRAHTMASGERIIFTGAMPRKEIDPVYAAADLFVFGSTTETQGLVVAEARAAGTPCVVVDKGGASENVRDGEDGLVVPPSLQPFTSAVRALLRDRPRLLAMREACRRNALHYTPNAMAERVTEVYEWALETYRPQTATASHRK